MAREELLPRQRAFADYYIALGNGAEAARRAGYRPARAGRTAARNLRSPKVRAYIEGRLREIESQRIAGAAEVMEHLTAAMRGEIREETVVIESRDGKSTSKKVSTQIAARDRLKAAELLAKRYGICGERQEPGGDRELIVRVDYGEEQDEGGAE